MWVAEVDVDGPADLPGIVGKRIIELGFLSTTTAARPPDEFVSASDDVVLELLVLAGTPALFVRNLSHVPGENELLIARSSEMQVISARYDQTMRRWIVRAVITTGER